MNSKKLEHIIGIVAAVFIITGVLFYAFEEPSRLLSAQANQRQTDLDEAMTLYAENCSICHGLNGEGIGSNPPLDNPGLAGTDEETLFKVISRGLYGTSMPAWNKTDGGPLSDYQIGELVTLIQVGDWQETGDRVVNLGLAPKIPFAAEPDPEVLASLADSPQGDVLTLGVTVYAQECVACHGVDGLGTDLAPALNDPAVREQPPEELERILENGVAGTLMAGWENILTEEEVEAVITLMTQWDQVVEGAIPAPEAPIPVTEESLALGGDLYTTNCARCHGPEGQGTPRAPSVNVKGYLESTTDAVLEQIITLGVPGTAMPTWGDKMTEIEIQALVGFIRAWEPTAPEVAEPARGGGGGPWWQTESGNSSGNGRGNGGGGGGGGGGQRNGQGGPPAWAGGQEQGNVEDPQSDLAASEVQAESPDLSPESTSQEEGGVTNPPETPATVKPREDQSTPVEVAGQEEETVDPISATNPGHEDSGNPPGSTGHGEEHSAGQSPPWAQNEEPQSWWESMDLRAWWVLLSVAILAVSLIAAAFFGLSRNPVPNNLGET